MSASVIPFAVHARDEEQSTADGKDEKRLAEMIENLRWLSDEGDESAVGTIEAHIQYYIGQYERGER